MRSTVVGHSPTVGSMYVKICGLRDRSALRAALDAGADAVGFVVSPGSPRDIDPGAAAELVAEVAGAADTVLVVSHAVPTEVVRLASLTGVDVVQLHGRYTAEDAAAVRASGVRMWRAASVADGTMPDVGAWGEELLLLDAPVAGSGKRWDARDVRTRIANGESNLAPLLAAAVGAWFRDHVSFMDRMLANHMEDVGYTPQHTDATA